MTLYQRRGRTRLAAGALITAGVLVAASCGGGDSGGGSGGGGSEGPITLQLDTFSEFGYEELIKQYEAEHPNIKIQHRNVETLNDYNPRLQKWIAAGEGAGDVVAVEEGTLLQYMAQPDAFVDLAEYGAAELEDNFIPWKWEAAVTEDGRVLGLGTDIGGMAMCYRRDLFKQAGLPSDRDEVGQAWQTWDDFVAMGEKFQGAMPDDVYFMAGPSTIFNAILTQRAGDGPGYTYFNREDELVIEQNPVVKQAYDQTLNMVDAGLTAGLENFSPEWQAGFQKSAFATVACPAWMLGQIQEFAGEKLKGKWDVTTVPGGGGNWGGSWLFVPAETDHPEAAAELAKFLTSPDSHTEAFKAANVLPSSPEALESEEVLNYKNEYFSNAPVGQIYAEGALALEPVYLGTDNLNVRQVVENTLLAYDAGELDRQQAWPRAVQDAKAEAR